LNIDFAALNRFKLDESAPATIGVDTELPLVPALPFRAADGEVAPPEHAAPAGEPEELGPAGDTLTVGTKSPLPDHTLPFHKPARPVAAQADAAPAPAPPAEASAPAPEGTREATALAPHLATMTIEQYAALCAECAVHPGWTAQVHARYQIQSEAERAALDGRWGERMAGNEELVRLWQWHYARFEQWFRQQGR
jgi:Meckel syndrome type 1 protein